MSGIKSKKVAYPVGVTYRYQTRIVNLLTNNGCCCNKGLPRWVNSRRVDKH